jgi:molybdopterin/thiamine biosynthesis adenylyltransferase
MYLRLAPHTQLISLGDDQAIVRDGRRFVKAPSSVAVSTLLALSKGTEVDIGMAGMRPEIRRMLGLLLKHHMLVMESERAFSPSGIAEKCIGYFASKTFFPWTAMRQLAESHVTVFGLGGVGSVVVQALLSVGVEKFHLVDCDIVELSNFNRQFAYCLEDIGRAKTECLAQYILARSQNAGVQLSNVKLDNRETVRAILEQSADTSIVINVADRPNELRRWVHLECEKAGIPCIDAGVGINTGYWGPLVSPANGDSFSAFERLLDSQTSPESTVSWAKDIQPTSYSYGPQNAVIAHELADLVISYIGGYLEASERCTRNSLDFISHNIKRTGLGR